MMSYLSAFFILIGLFALELGYFRIAEHFQIIDRPNARSSHERITLRGGGIIFCLAALIYFVRSEFQYPFFIGGLVSIAAISFIDDVLTLNNKLRLGIHLLAVLLLFIQWDILQQPYYILLIGGVFVIGTINAYNFMDGINGITGSYSLLTILTLGYINSYQVPFIDADFLLIIAMSLLVFCFFNFRKKAKCFAGDVGSVAMAFILVFLIGKLIIQTANLAYVLLLLIYGLDTISTIIFRKIRKENIFEAHRSHFYQYLANQLKFSHLRVSLLYLLAQVLVNLVLLFLILNSLILSLIFAVVLACCFIWLRFKTEGAATLVMVKE